MLRSQANWNFMDKDNRNEESELNKLSLSSQTKRLLLQRGIKSEHEAKMFLNPEISQLHAPSLLNDMDKATDRIMQAIENGESILVFGDYDADGVSSTAVMMEALTELGAICDYYIPNRFTEGYGPNEEAFKEAYKQGFTLIITVDTGIAAVQEAEVAKELGIDLILTDHHEVQETLPDAYAIIHPKCSSEYPFKELAGVGVAFKLAHHLLGYFPDHLLDLAVIGTIADLVPLVDENRILAYHGLKAISNTKRLGIKALKQQCKIEGPMDEEHIGFLIGPRINAVGRLQDANPAVELLLTDDPNEASNLAEFIQELNQERQNIVSDIAREAQTMVEQDSTGENNQVIVVAKEGWNEGVLGIVASKLVRSYDRPAIVLSINKEKQQAKGSARSIDAFDLFANCMDIRDTFIHFGGHAQAAGMTLTEENIYVLRKKLNEKASSQLSEEDYKQLLKIDSTVDIENLEIATIDEIKRLAPFGMGNPKPLFHTSAIPSEIRQIGSQKTHLKITLQKGASYLDCIGFGMGDKYYHLSAQSEIDAIGELDINEWNGKQKVQLLLKDLAVKDWQLFDFRGSFHWHKEVPPLHNESIAIHFQELSNTTQLPEGIQSFLYSDELLKSISDKKYVSLFLLDLPQALNQLTGIFNHLLPEKIYACYRMGEGNYFSTVPPREDFKWFYGMLLKRKQFVLEKDTSLLMSHKGWKQDKIKFIVKVFFELGFVKIENGIITPNSNPAKKDLNESATYQTKLRQTEIEEILFYSNYNQLKEWFSQQMDQVELSKEEVVHGL